MNNIFSLDPRRHPRWMNFMGEKYFGNFVFDASRVRNNTKTVSLTTYALKLGTRSSYSEMQQLGITNFAHLHHV